MYYIHSRYPAMRSYHFDLNLLMAHTAIFSKSVGDEMTYDNWHTAICMKYYYSGSTNSLAQMAQKSLPYAFKTVLTLLKY